MDKAISDFLFGLFFGCGFAVSYGLIQLAISVLSNARLPHRD
jgi:hypothetical protein